MSIRRLLPFLFTTVADPPDARAQLYIIILQPPWSGYDRIGRSSDAARFAAISAGRLAFALHRVRPGLFRGVRLFGYHHGTRLVQGPSVPTSRRKSRCFGMLQVRQGLPAGSLVQ